MEKRRDGKESTLLRAGEEPPMDEEQQRYERAETGRGPQRLLLRISPAPCQQQTLAPNVVGKAVLLG